MLFMNHFYTPWIEAFQLSQIKESKLQRERQNMATHKAECKEVV